MIDNLASSPNRGEFSKRKFNEILNNKDDHSESSIKHAEVMLDFLSSFDNQRKQYEESDEFKKDNLEYDLRTTEWIINKVKNSESYAQNLYAAMCNNTFQKMNNWCILSDQQWSCSWRSAGGIVANMKGEGDYCDYYCSGIRGNKLDEDSDHYKNLTEAQKQYMIISEQFVSESIVTDEIKNDLRKLGWVVLDEQPDI